MEKKAIAKILRKGKINACVWRVFGDFLSKNDMERKFYNDQKTFALSKFDKRKIGTSEKIYDIDGKRGVVTYVHTAKGPIVKEENGNVVQYYGFVEMKSYIGRPPLAYISVSYNKETREYSAVTQTKGTDFISVTKDIGYEYIPDHLPYDFGYVRLEETFKKMESHFNCQYEKTCDKGRE